MPKEPVGGIYRIIQIVGSVLIIGAITALWLKRGIDWQKSRGQEIKKHYMEEYGFMDDKDNKL